MKPKKNCLHSNLYITKHRHLQGYMLPIPGSLRYPDSLVTFLKINYFCITFDIQYYVSHITFRCTIWLFDIFRPYNVITPVILGIIFWCVNLSQYYWLYSPLLFTCPNTSSSANHPLCLYFYESYFVLFCLFAFFFLNSTYKWNI